MDKSIKIVLIFTVLMILITTILYFSLTGGFKVTALKSTASINGLISQSLFAGTLTSKVPVVNKSYRISNIRYWNNKAWITANFTSLDQADNSGTIILKNINGNYQLVLGPSNSFSSDYLISLPGNIGTYLTHNKEITNPYAN